MHLYAPWSIMIAKIEAPHQAPPNEPRATGRGRWSSKDRPFTTVLQNRGLHMLEQETLMSLRSAPTLPSSLPEDWPGLLGFFSP